MKKYIKIPILLFIICILLELLLFGYKVVINKGFQALHLIGNTPIEIGKEQIQIDTTSDPDYNYLIVNQEIKEVYNVTLQLKEKNVDSYVRIVGNMDQLMQKSNQEEDNFKAYFNKAVEFKELQIAYPKTQIEENNIDKIIINSNVDYVPQAKISITEFAILFGIAIGIYMLVIGYQCLAKTNRKLKLENVFLMVSLLMGVILTFVSAPLAKYDEHAHFWRTYEIANGNLVSEITNEFPTSVARMIIDENKKYHINDINYQSTLEKFENDLNPEDKTALAVGATAGNSPFSYLPPLVGTFIGMVLKLKPVIIVYMGRLCNVIAYSILMYFSIKLMPKKKWKQIIAIIGLFPMSLNLAASYSPDTTIISVAIFMFAYVMHLKFGERKVQWKDPIILGISAFIIVICKIVYFPMLLLFFLIPKEKFANQKMRILAFVVMIGVFLAGNGIWKLVPQGSGEVAIRASATEQLYYTVSDPMRTLGIMANTVITLTPQYMMEMVGGWNTPNIISVILLALLLLTIFYQEDDKIELKIQDKIWLWVISIIEIGLIFVGFYVSWTKAHWDFVDGIQGRYFLPILPLISVAMTKGLVEGKIKNKEWKLLWIIILLYIPTIVTTIQAFI